MRAYIFDTETTGTDPKVDKVIQSSAIEIDFDNNGQLVALGQKTAFFDHDCEAGAGALAIHGLTLDKIRSKDNCLDCKSCPVKSVSEDMVFMIGHNIKFDWEMVGRPAVRLIDTLKIVRWMHADWQDHNLGASAIQAAELLLGDKAQMIERVKSAHDAEFDVQLNFDVLRYICWKGNIGNLTALWINYDQTWRFPTKFAFGKYKGQPISVVKQDRGYAGWILREPDMDEDVKEAVRRQL